MYIFIVSENEFEEYSHLNIYDLTLFIPKEEENCYYKYEETHYQKGYTIDEIIDCLKAANLEFVAAFDAFTKNPPKEDSERIYFVAKECQK